MRRLARTRITMVRIIIIDIIVFSHDVQNNFAKDRPGVEGEQQHCVNSCCTISAIA